MQRSKIFALSWVAQIGYFAILLQAFVMPPPIEYFGPCGCSIHFEYTQRLTLYNNLPSSGTRSTPADKASANTIDPFCSGSPRNRPAIHVSNLALDKSLERLMFKQARPVQLCLTVDDHGAIVSTKAQSESLSAADESLLADYITRNWTVSAALTTTAKPAAGSYSMTLGTMTEMH
jgi:hypothetical protein